VITRLKRLPWVRNPYFIKYLDWSAMVDMAVTVAMDMFVEEDVHMVTDLDPASFWPVIEPLVRGKIFTAKQKAKQQLKQICGNAQLPPAGARSCAIPRTYANLAGEAAINREARPVCVPR
jgi:hypothetical protein